MFPLLHYWWSRPDALQWVWISIATGIVALGVATAALPTVFQMIWGRATIKVEFLANQHPQEDWLQLLKCDLSQPPTPRWLKRLGVRRTSTLVTVRMVIERVESGTEVASFIPLLRNINRDTARQMEIAGSELTSAFFFVAVRLTDGVFASPTRDAKDLIPLKNDVYSLTIKIVYGEDAMQLDKRFVVAADSLYWA